MPIPHSGARRAREGARSGPATDSVGYAGSRFADVWNAVASDPYDALPDGRIGFGTLLKLPAIHRAARRTLETKGDLLPPFDKLVHPVGICLRGTWRITERTSYTGYFATGAEGLLIARASDTMGENRPGHLRFLALAGKLFPTRDPDHPQPLPTADFVANESLLGSHTRHFVHAAFSNDLLPFEPKLDPRMKIPVGAAVTLVFAIADRARGLRSTLKRQLHPVTELGEPEGAPSHGPNVMRLVGSPQNRAVDTPELREELRMQHHPEGIRFTIEVTDEARLLIRPSYRRIGEVHFVDSVASYTGDHRLHFHHPPFRPERHG